MLKTLIFLSVVYMKIIKQKPISSQITFHNKKSGQIYGKSDNTSLYSFKSVLLCHIFIILYRN